MGNCLKREIGFEVEEDQNDTADVEEIIKKIVKIDSILMILESYEKCTNVSATTHSELY